METLTLFPLGTALFPGGLLPLRIFEVRYLHLMRQCIEQKQAFGIVPLLAGREVRTPENHEILASAGTVACIEQHLQTTPGLMHVRCRGEQRFRLVDVSLGAYGLWSGRIERLEDRPGDTAQEDRDRASQALGRLLDVWQRQGLDPLPTPWRLDDPAWVADRWAELLPFTPKEQEALLLTDDVGIRLCTVTARLREQGVGDEA